MQKPLLCIDAATPHMALALGPLNAPRATSVYVREDLDRKNSEQIGEAIHQLCERAKIAPKQIEGIACGVGPGTFTGTRVAVATAKGLALALNARLWALDSLSMFAAPHAAQDPGLVVLDARRGELYAAMYGPTTDAEGWTQQSPVSCVPIAELNAKFPHAPQWVAGTGTGLVDPSKLCNPRIITAELDPQWLWQAGRRATLQECVDPAALDVFYLRASYAEIGANPPKTPPYRCPFVSDNLG